MSKKPRRKPNRLEGYDYRLDGAYFVTICSKDRAELFSTIVGATVPGRPRAELTELGKIINDAILCNNRDGVFIDRYVIMPNHIHLLIVYSGLSGDRGRSPLQMIIRNMKAFITKQIGYSPWQKSFHDHIIRDEKNYRRIAEYIDNNPATWEDDCFYQK